jgi:F-type H+-transporting ATPase subunit alpha
MAVRPEEIASIIKQQIEQFGGEVTAVDVGSVVEAGDGIARVYGLSNAVYSELLEFRTKDDAGAAKTIMGLALNLEEDTVGAIILGEYTDIKEGDEVRSTGRIIQVPVGDGLVGRVVDPLGQPLDGKGPVPRPASSCAKASVSRCTPASRRSTPWCRSGAASASWSSATALRARQ